MFFLLACCKSTFFYIRTGSCDRENFFVPSDIHSFSLITVRIFQPSSLVIIAETDTLTLSVPQPHPRHVTKKKSKPSGDGQMPEWMQKFVSERQINLDEDVKFVESSPSTPSSADE